MKVFNKWDTNIEIIDPGLKRYINLKPIMVPKTGGRTSKVQFWKSKTPIIERFIKKVMVPGHKGKVHRVVSGHCTGKATHAYKVVENAFGIIEKKLNKNPVEVFIRALENASPREEITTIEYGGARYPQAVECAPQRRIDIALRMMIQGAYSKSFKTKKKIADCLADEVILAYKLDRGSTAISKKLELERQADASR